MFPSMNPSHPLTAVAQLKARRGQPRNNPGSKSRPSRFFHMHRSPCTVLAISPRGLSKRNYCYSRGRLRDSGVRKEVKRDVRGRPSFPLRNFSEGEAMSPPRIDSGVYIGSPEAHPSFATYRCSTSEPTLLSILSS